MNLDQATEFINSYLDAEYAEAKALRSEGDAVLSERQKDSESHFLSTPESPMFSVIGRRPGYTDAELEEYAQTLDQVARRVLFMVVEFEHKERGAIFCGYVSGAGPTITGAYELQLFIQEVGGKPKIIAQYAAEILKPAPPVQWTHVQGAEVSDPGTPVTARAFTEPTFNPHRLDWAATRELGNPSH
ncbi:hypothetical protein ACIQZN_19460 [Streptomyces sp. NPDC097595]|uniref:hypothetical protein n=1 Tax=Streptomyces sp. NPDC097595 TaxID=3366090 RepID=UPI003827DF76